MACYSLLGLASLVHMFEWAVGRRQTWLSDTWKLGFLDLACCGYNGS